MSSIKYKNRYSINEFFRLCFSFVFTKLFWRKAKLVCYPISIRGKKSFVYGKRFSCGYNCRFDLINTKKKTLFIGDNCEINDFCHIVATEMVVIGDNFLCASKVFISDTNHGNYNENDCPPTIDPKERELFSKPVRIGNNVWVGENVVILPGANIGNGCIIGANSVVTKEIPDNCIAVGNPARVIKKYDDKTKKWERIKNENFNY